MERRDVPIHLVFRSNAAEGLANLSLIEKISRESLDSNPNPVGIFLEAADITKAEADFFQSQIQKGIPPSDSLFSTAVRRYPRLLQGALFWLFRSDYVVFNPDSFRSRQLRLLDTLSQDYPQRVHPILEQGSADDVNLNRLAARLGTDILDKPDLKFDPNVPADLYPATSNVVGDIRQSRQDRMAEVIQRAILETDISSLVGHLHIANQRVGFALQRAGFSVKTHFAQKTNT